MTSNTLVDASLNAFSVEPSEDRLITVPASLLESLQDEIRDLKVTVTRQQEDIASLKAAEKLNFSDIRDLYAAIDEIDHLQKEPGKTELSRVEKIEKYLQTRPDHRATFETLKGHLGIDKHRLREAIRTLMMSSPGRYGIIRASGDKRKQILVMLPK